MDRNIDTVTIRLAKWPQESETLRRLRNLVFVDEQQVPADIEWDNRDCDAIHFLALDSDNQAIATARLLSTGQLGRMAVLSEWRNCGLGSKLLRYVLDWARATQTRLFLHAQVNAIPFYQRAGFVTYGEQFMEAGIQHQSMRIDLSVADV